MAELLVYVQRLPPGTPGAGRVGHGVVRVAEPIERLRLPEAVAQLLIELKCATEAVEGTVRLAQMVVGVTEAVPRRRHRVAVTYLPHQRQRLAAVANGQLVPAEHGVA